MMDLVIVKNEYIGLLQKPPPLLIQSIKKIIASLTDLLREVKKQQHLDGLSPTYLKPPAPP